MAAPVRAHEQLAAARTCYDHLAGALGVAVFDALVHRGLVDVRGGLALTTTGRAWFIDLAGPAVLRPARSRPLLRGCLDWTERRHHLGGALGAASCAHLIAQEYLERSAHHGAVAVTTAGARALDELLGLGSPRAGRLGSALPISP